MCNLLLGSITPCTNNPILHIRLTHLRQLHRAHLTPLCPYHLEISLPVYPLVPLPWRSPFRIHRIHPNRRRPTRTNLPAVLVFRRLLPHRQPPLALLPVPST